MFQTNCVGFQKESEGFGFTQVKVKGNAYSEPSSGQVMVWDNTNIGKMIKSSYLMSGSVSSERIRCIVLNDQLSDHQKSNAIDL